MWALAPASSQELLRLRLEDQVCRHLGQNGSQATAPPPLSNIKPVAMLDPILRAWRAAR